MCLAFAAVIQALAVVQMKAANTCAMAKTNQAVVNSSLKVKRFVKFIK